MRRAALLLAAPVLAAGLLAGCDLPGGSPKVLGPDKVPNDSQDSAARVSVPAFVNGTVDGSDTTDWFQPQPLTTDVFQGAYASCTGNVEVTGVLDLGSTSDERQVTCDGSSQFIGDVRAGAEAFVHVEVLDDTFTPYFLTITYGTALG